MDKRFLVFVAVLIAGLVTIALINLSNSGGRNGTPVTHITYSRFLDEVGQGRVASVSMAGQDVHGTYDNGALFRTYAADDPALVAVLRANDVSITATAPPREGPTALSLLADILPIVLLIGLFGFFMWRTSGGNRRAAAFGKSKARLLTEERERIMFGDVAGVDEAKANLQEIVDFLRDPEKSRRLGGRIPRGVLLVGPPGSGKTLLVRAVAGEAGVPFYSISGSDFVEMFVGIGASRVRDLFEQAKKNSPCIVFVDEIDAVGRHRGAGLGQGNDEREQTLNQLLVEMDGFEPSEEVILIAATNRPDVLDPALVRPGRFDRQVVVDNPDVVGREQILKVHTRKVPIASEVDLALLAKATPGFSGADLMNLVNEAALLAARRAKDEVGRAEFDAARDRVTMGDERRTQVLAEADRQLVAYRESGRALVALTLPAADPIHKVTIIPHGRTIGMVKQTPETDRMSVSLEQAHTKLAILMAGRAAEDLAFGPQQITSGAAGDIADATRLARQMVTRWGLSEGLGPVAYEENEEEVFLGHSVSRRETISDQDVQSITAEIRKMIEEALDKSRLILSERRGELETLASALLNRETLSGQEVLAVLASYSSPKTAIKPDVIDPTVKTRQRRNMVDEDPRIPNKTTYKIES